MKLAMGQFGRLAEERLRFVKQLGVDNVLLARAELPGERRWEFKDLLFARTQCEDAGLKLAGIETLPQEFYDRVRLGPAGRDEQIENLQATIRNLGRAGIPILGYHWMPSQVWRTSCTIRLRGGALTNGFDHDLASKAPLTHGREYTEQEMWQNYVYFLKAVVPVAEEAGVRLALHPDDPPVPSLGGIARIFRSFEGLKRAVEAVPSRANCLRFCQGTYAEMGEDVLAGIRYFGACGKIAVVHFRDIQGTAASFRETFIDEGQTDLLAAMRAYKEVGYDGYLTDDHVPHLVDDTEWGHRARAYSIGYMKALLRVVNG